MKQADLISSIERRAARAGLTIGKLCEMAEVHPTTFSRWKPSVRNPNPVGPTFRTIEKIEAALSAAEARAAA